MGGEAFVLKMYKLFAVVFLTPQIYPLYTCAYIGVSHQILCESALRLVLSTPFSLSLVSFSEKTLYVLYPQKSLPLVTTLEIKFESV